MGAVGTGVTVLGVVGTARDIARDIENDEYGAAAVKAGKTGASFTSLAPVVFAHAVIEASNDPQLREDAQGAGEWVENHTGIKTFGTCVEIKYQNEENHILCRRGIEIDHVLA